MNKKREQSLEQLQSEAVLGLEETVGSIASRIQKTLNQKAKLQQQNAGALKARQKFLLQALSTVRRALESTCKISLGTRFHLDLLVEDDAKGWPRITLLLVDDEAPQHKEMCLTVSGRFRKGQGVIEFSRIDGSLVKRVSVESEEELKALPKVLKRLARAFLTEVADYVVNPRQPENITRITEKAEATAVKPASLGEDVFSESFQTKRNVLPSEKPAANETTRDAPQRPSKPTSSPKNIADNDDSKVLKPVGGPPEHLLSSFSFDKGD